MTSSRRGYPDGMARRIREEYIEDEPVVTRRRVVTERRIGGPVGYGMNPVGLVVALLVAVLLIALLFGVR